MNFNNIIRSEPYVLFYTRQSTSTGSTLAESVKQTTHQNLPEEPLDDYCMYPSDPEDDDVSSCLS